MNQTLDKAAQLIEEALAANLALQSQYKKKLEEISKIKVQNRLDCIEIKNALHRHWKQKYDTEEVGGSAGDVTRRKTADTKWKRRYFIDSKKSTPPPNSDTVLRRKWEGDLASETYLYRFTPWSKEELSVLLETAEEVRNEQRQRLRQERERSRTDARQIDPIVKDADINFREVATRVYKKLSKTKPTNAQKASLKSHTYSLSEEMVKANYVPRPWMDYRIKFLNSVSPSINKRPFTKVESMKIIEFLHKYNGNPPWHLVAQALNTSRTPFQCFHHAQTKLSHTLSDLSSSVVFSPDEDELLFKFIAASGPQMVMNYHTTTLMAQKFFPQASHFQVLNRANTTLINPQFSNEKWKEEEVRTLAMAMKVYSKTDNPLARASFLLEGRSTKMVTDKWVNALNPCYSTKPFSYEEDRALMEAVKRVNATPENWNAIASEFPTRNPKALMSRWMELANVEDLAKMQAKQLVKRGIRRMGRRNAKTSRKVNRIEELEHSLSIDDFAVTFKKKQRNR